MEFQDWQPVPIPRVMTSGESQISVVMTRRRSYSKGGANQHQDEQVYLGLLASDCINGSRDQSNQLNFSNGPFPSILYKGNIVSATYPKIMHMQFICKDLESKHQINWSSSFLLIFEYIVVAEFLHEWSSMMLQDSSSKC